ncbi:AAA family ATPase [Hymenobacter nivis]|uniref:Rad50/SbcC-type AAA domain-containing protein n=1 Tax=Hymenobacter nivis TaxID=1850093 RepID=A0A2Z3GTV3_9BACT|nr:AAA family ATPase [Hymenobacter nivis]AWM35107.1 hypothetical protein DDQ68_21465 [Hymenobacter nivis]
MKIISVRFANLNSLPGPYLIRFDAAPLADTGLFAITGPTGAGKSTLLDAIAVGLYGRVPRHDRQVGEMVSRHAAFAFSEVEFEVHETDADTGAVARVRYRSRWEVKRKVRGDDKGGLGQDAMSLVMSPSNEAIVSGKEAVPAKVGELSGLDFGQFEQSVLLSQGKFARFLHAPEKERSALLEKMTNVGIYSRLSVAAFEKAKAEELQTKLLRAQLEATRLLPDDERGALETQLDRLHEEAEGHYEEQHELTIFLTWRAILDQLERQLYKTTSETEDLRRTEELLRPDSARLDGHLRATNLGAPLALAAAAEQELNRDVAQLEALDQALPLLAQATQEAEARYSAAADSHTAALTTEDQLRPVLQAARQQDAEIASAQQRLTKNHTAHDHNQAAHEVEQAAWQKTQTHDLAALGQQQTASEAWLLAHNHEAQLKDELIEIGAQISDLESVNTELATLEAQQQAHLQQLAEATADHKRHEQAGAGARQTQQALVEQGRPSRDEVTELLRGTDADALAQHDADLTARLQLVQRLLPLAQAAHDHAARAQGLHQEHAQEETTRDLAETAFAHLTERQGDGQRLLDSYQRELRAQQALADLNAHRQQLQTDQPCPLCGALEHTFGADFAADANEYEVRVEAQKQALAHLSAELTRTGQDLVRRRTEQQQRRARHDETTAAAELARRQATELAAALAPPLPDLADLAAVQHLLDDTAAAQATTGAARRRLVVLTEQLAQLRADHTAAGAVIKQAQEEAQRATERQQKAQQSLGPVAAGLANFWEQADNYRAVIQGLLVPHSLRLPTAGQPYSGVRVTLEERANEYLAQAQSLTDLQHKAATLRDRQTDRAATLALAQATLRATAQALAAEQQLLDQLRTDRLALYAGSDPAADAEQLHQATQQLDEAKQLAFSHRGQQQQNLAIKQAAQRTLNAQLTEHRAAHNARQTELAAALATAGFHDAAEARALLLPAAEAERLHQRRHDHLVAQTAATRRLADLTAELGHHAEAGLTPHTGPELDRQLAELNKADDILQQQLGAISNQLSQDDAARLLLADGLRALQQRQLEEQRWQDLSEQIGSAKGDKFSQFAQGLTLSHLARLANLRLRQLTGRYTILKTPNRNLELQIIDHDQADTVRPMASLSGGESFLVSLALALGLSELAGHKARIESLFIDEGFGTLDPDALNTALDALERLQHSGKMIGIISHVADLKDRIGTQIRIQPGAGGTSTVRVVDVMGTETSCEA